MKLELTPEIEQRITEEAERHGQRPSDYAVALLRSALPATFEAKERPFYETASPEEWARKFREWAESHSYVTAPPLSDEALRRENMFED